MRILIIEDSGPSAYLLASLCEGANRHCEIASTLSEAWARLRGRHKYDVIFFDLGLRDSSPIESAKLVPQFKNFSRVVIVTGYGNPELKVEASEADAFLLKDDPDFADKVIAQLK